MSRCLVSTMVLAQICASYLADPHARGGELSESAKAAAVLISSTGTQGEIRRAGTYIYREKGSVFVAASALKIANTAIAKDDLALTFFPGAKNEWTIKARVVLTADDLGVVILRGEVPDGTAVPPLLPASKTMLRETDALKQLGFLAGENQLAAGPRAAPTAAVVKVSSLRKDTDGHLAVLQVDGVANAGQLGAPLLDDKGGLAGVTLARIPNSFIGLALPTAKIEELFAGRAGPVSIRTVATDERRSTLRVTVQIQDPLKCVDRAAAVFYSTLAAKAAEPAAILDLKIAAGEGVGDIELPGNLIVYRFQIQVNTIGQPPRSTPMSDVSRTVSAAESSESNKAAPAETERAARDSAQHLARQTSTVVDAKVTRLGLDASRELPCMRFSADGRYLFTLEVSGIVRRIAVPSFVVERELNIGENCTDMESSKEGLLIAAPAPGHVWQIDPETLNVKAKIVVPGVIQLAAAPGQSVAFAAANASVIVPLDLITGLVAKPIRIAEISRGAATEFLRIRMTPDGRYLLTCSHAITRFEVAKTALKYQQCSPWVGSHIEHSAVNLTISPDSRSVVLLDKSGYDSNRLKVLGIADFKINPIDFDPDCYPVFAWDKDGSIFTRSRDRQLARYESDATPGKTYYLPTLGSPRQFLVHPSGRKLLILGDELHWLNFE